MFRTIDPELWRDPKVKKLDIEAKLLWLYLLTNEHTHLSGLYHLPLPYITHETGLSDKGLKRGLQVLEQSLMVQYDHEAEAVWVRKMLRRQKGVNAENKNAWKSIQTQLESFRDSDLVQGFMLEYNDLGLPFKAPSKPLQRGLDIVIDIDKDTLRSERGVGKTKAPVKRESEWTPPKTDDEIAAFTEEVKAHVRDKGYRFDPVAFVAHYASKGWMMGKSSVKNWKQACVTWERGYDARPKPQDRNLQHEEFFPNGNT